MELFEKLYGQYYIIVRKILIAAAQHPLSAKEIEQLAREDGFQESALSIVPKLLSGSWPLLCRQENGLYIPALSHPQADYALTELQKSWLAFLLSDIRISLFLTEEEQRELSGFLQGVTPCAHPSDFHYFDRFKDRDPYESPEYQQNFRTILKAIKQKKAVFIAYSNKSGRSSTHEVVPKNIVYSSRDDKFRLACIVCTPKRRNSQYYLNFNRILACHISIRDLSENRYATDTSYIPRPATEPVVIEINGERNSLERCMLHFAQYKKQTEYDEEKRVYRCSIYYDIEDEPQLLIEILSFGPVIRVIGPDPFLRSVKERVQRQHELFYRPT